jgi:hypothetical protein
MGIMRLQPHELLKVKDRFVQPALLKKRNTLAGILLKIFTHAATLRHNRDKNVMQNLKESFLCPKLYYWLFICFPKGDSMTRLLSLAIVTLACLLPACSTQVPEPEAPAPAAEAPMPIPPPIAPFVDVLPEFKKSSRAFLDLAKTLDAAAGTNPPPSYQIYWKECEPMEEVYTKVISNGPKAGPGANTFDRINKIRNSLFQTRLLLKNKDGAKTSQLVQLLATEAEKRQPLFDEAEFFWKQTPDFTKQED